MWDGAVAEALQMSTTLKVMKRNGSTTRTAVTPPSSPVLPPAKQFITMEHAQQFLEPLKVAAATNPISSPALAEVPASEGPTEVMSRASKPEYRTVNEVYAYACISV